MKKFKIYYLIYIFCFFSVLFVGFNIFLKRNSNKSINNSLEIVATPTIIPIDIPTPTSIPTPTITPKPTIKEDPQIDCIGPDGKHCKTTEIECKKFNDAWSNPKPTLKSEKILVPTMSYYDNAWCQATLKIYKACVDAYNWCLTQPNAYCPYNCINKPTCLN